MNSLISEVLLHCVLLASPPEATRVTPPATQEKISREAKVWDERHGEIRQLGKKLNKILSRHGRIVRRGTENSYLESLIVSAINSTNKSLKNRGLAVQVAKPGGTLENQTALTPHEIQLVLGSMDPYRREYVEQSLVEKNKIGILLVGRALGLVDLPERLENTAFLDLESYTKVKDRKFDEIIKDFIRRAGPRYYVLILPKVELPDASFSASSHFTVEQVADGSLNVYQERLKAREEGILAVQVFTVAPRNLLFIRKEDLRKPLTESTVIRSFVMSSFKETEVPEEEGEAEEADTAPEPKAARTVQAE